MSKRKREGDHSASDSEAKTLCVLPDTSRAPATIIPREIWLLIFTVLGMAYAPVLRHVCRPFRDWVGHAAYPGPLPNARMWARMAMLHFVGKNHRRLVWWLMEKNGVYIREDAYVAAATAKRVKMFDMLRKHSRHIPGMATAHVAALAGCLEILKKVPGSMDMFEYDRSRLAERCAEKKHWEVALWLAGRIDANPPVACHALTNNAMWKVLTWHAIDQGNIDALMYLDNEHRVLAKAHLPAVVREFKPVIYEYLLRRPNVDSAEQLACHLDISGFVRGDVALQWINWAAQKGWRLAHFIPPTMRYEWKPVLDVMLAAPDYEAIWDDPGYCKFMRYAVEHGYTHALELGEELDRFIVTDKVLKVSTKDAIGSPSAFDWLASRGRLTVKSLIRAAKNQDYDLFKILAWRGKTTVEVFRSIAAMKDCQRFLAYLLELDCIGAKEFLLESDGEYSPSVRSLIQLSRDTQEREDDDESYRDPQSEIDHC